MNSEIKTFKSDYGYTEWKDIQKHVDSLKNGFKYYYENTYHTMKTTKKIEFSKTGRILTGHLKWWKGTFKGRIHKIIWPSCNNDKPIVFFNSNTLYYE